MLIIDSHNWRTLVFDMMIFFHFTLKAITMTTNIDSKSVFVVKISKFEPLWITFPNSNNIIQKCHF